MIDQKLLEALNKQFDRERENHAFYRAMSYALENLNWSGSAAFMMKSSNEEQEHADKIAHYIVDRGEAPTFDSIDPVIPPTTDNLVPFFEAALRREQETTTALRELYYLAEQVEDAQTCSFLEVGGYFEEQTQSERELTDILLMLRRLDDNGRVVYDKEIGQM